MKTTLKTTALAILVALGATACLSNSGGGGSKEQPKPIQPNNQTPPTNPNQSNTSNGQNDKTSSSDGKTTPPNKADGDKGNKGDSSKDDKGNNSGENNTPPKEDKNKIAEITVVTPEGYDYNATSKVDNVSWRVINLAKDVDAGKNDIFSISSDNKLNAEINLDELSEHSLTSKQASTTLGENKVNYAFVNQPYSSYGILTTEAQDNSVAFASGYGPDNRSIDKLPKGGAKYTGHVLAAIGTNKDAAVISDDSVPTLEFRQPQYDGNVELSLKIDNPNEGAPYVLVSGKIDSKVLGKEINLAQTDVDNFGIFAGNAKVNDVPAGRYVGAFAGKEYSEAVGTVNLNDRSKTGYLGKTANGEVITSYQAAFGATKQ